jgi:deazaflavin-dependent oxidoreductase (nitroreductase family)
MSVKLPPKGTRGVRVPRFLAGFGARMMRRQFRRSGGAKTQGGLHAFLLETTGAKSGQPRHAVLGFIEETPDSWLVIASAVGAAHHPGWLHNLAAHPDAIVELGDGSRIDVRTETLEGADLSRAWERIATEAPEYLAYRTKTDREIPVVRLRHTGTVTARL